MLNSPHRVEARNKSGVSKQQTFVINLQLLRGLTFAEFSAFSEFLGSTVALPNPLFTNVSVHGSLIVPS